jgi:hypothetical protein
MYGALITANVGYLKNLNFLPAVKLSPSRHRKGLVFKTVFSTKVLAVGIAKTFVEK